MSRVLIATSCFQGEEPTEEKSSLEMQGAQRIMETKWFYRDPQGQEQGPFSNDEMVEWFHHGYFTMQLSVRRQCDAAYLSLGTFNHSFNHRYSFNHSFNHRYVCQKKRRN
jgi:hypothetical protein